MAASRRRVGLVALGDDALRTIASFLTARDVASLARVCQDTDRVCGSKTVWARLYQEDFLLAGAGPDDALQLHSALRGTTSLLVPPVAARHSGGHAVESSPRSTARAGTPVSGCRDPRELYRIRHHERLEAVRRVREEQRAVGRRNEVRAKRKRLRCCIDIAQVVAGCVVPLACALSTVALVVDFLDKRYPTGDAPQDPNAWLSLVAAIVVLAAGFFCFACAVCMNCCMNRVSRASPPETSPWHGQWDVDSRAFEIGLAINMLANPLLATNREKCCNRAQLCFLTSLIVLGVLTPLLVLGAALSAEGSSGGGSDGVPWYSLCMIPFYIVIFGAPCFFVMEPGKCECQADRAGALTVTVVCIALPVAVSAGLGAARADKLNDLPLWLVCVPLFVMDGLLALVGCVVTVIAMVSAWREGASRRRILEPGWVCFVITVVLCCTVLTLQILIVLRLDGGLQATWGQISVPIFLLLVPSLALCGFGGCRCSDQSRTSFNNDNRFESIV